MHNGTLVRRVYGLAGKFNNLGEGYKPETHGICLRHGECWSWGTSLAVPSVEGGWLQGLKEASWAPGNAPHFNPVVHACKKSWS